MEEFPKDTHNEKYQQTYNIKMCALDFPGGAVVKNPPANAGDTG